MKTAFSLFLSCLIFAASFQNSLFVADYYLNQDYYELHCINKSRPELACHGKCEAKKQSESSSSALSSAKYAFEFNILPAPAYSPASKPAQFTLKPVKIFSGEEQALKPAFRFVLPDPPQTCG